MKKSFWLGLFILTAISSHFYVLNIAPRKIMTNALGKIEALNTPYNRLVLAKRITAQTQRVERPSPDLAYSTCLFDLSRGNILITATKWDDYGSLTVFDHKTDVAFIARLNTPNLGARPSRVILTLGKDYISSDDIPVVYLTAPKGFALIRRLAPNQARYDIVKSLAKTDSCTLVP